MKTTKKRRRPKAPARLLSPRGAPFRKLAAKLRQTTGPVTIGADDVRVVLQALDLAAADCEPTSDGAIGRKMRRAARKRQGGSARQRKWNTKERDTGIIVDWMERTLRRVTATSADQTDRMSTEVILEMAKEWARARETHGKVPDIKKERRALRDIIKPRLRIWGWSRTQQRSKTPLHAEQIIAENIQRLKEKLANLDL